MKRFSLLLLTASVVVAAGTVTQQGPTQLGNSDTRVFEWAWTGDATTGSVPASVAASLRQQQYQGYIVLGVEFVPGTPSPTASYDVTLTDDYGYDILVGGGANLSATAASAVLAGSAVPPLNGALTLNVTNNAVASAKGRILLYMSRADDLTIVRPFGASGGSGTSPCVLAGGQTLGDVLTATDTSTNCAWLPPIVLTTTGSSGAATYTKSTSTLNIPQYSGGGGGVSSVSFTGGLISVASPTTTPALTVAGTSGGIPCFSSTSTWTSSALLTGNALLIGGGNGLCPSATTTASGMITFLGAPSSANLAATVTDETGSGALVFGTSPTFVTPALGTPSSGNASNLTNLPITLTTSGTSGASTYTQATNTLNIPQYTSGGTPGGSTTQCQYNNASSFGGITGCTSNGTTITLVAPILGTPASVTLTNGTGLPISTGVSGLGSGVATFLATPSGANLASALTTSLPNTKGGTGGDSSGSTGLAHVTAGTWSYSTLVNADISASAGIALSKLASQAADTLVINATGGSAAPTAVPLSSCSGASNALNYNTTTHAIGCASITASVSVAGSAITDSQCWASASTLGVCANIILSGALTTGTSPPAVTPGTGGGWACNEGTVPSVGAASGVDLAYCDSTSHTFKASYNNGPYYPLTQTIASGTKALATSAISSEACSSAQTSTATGTLTTDTVTASFNGDPTAVTGYVPLVAGMLTIIAYPTADTVSFKVCNNTSSSVTPGAITLNWKVVR